MWPVRILQSIFSTVASAYWLGLFKNFPPLSIFFFFLLNIIYIHACTIGLLYIYLSLQKAACFFLPLKSSSSTQLPPTTLQVIFVFDYLPLQIHLHRLQASRYECNHYSSQFVFFVFKFKSNDFVRRWELSGVVKKQRIKNSNWGVIILSEE